MEVQPDFRDLLELFNFIANKRALGRKKDLADLEAIGEDWSLVGRGTEHRAGQGCEEKAPEHLSAQTL